MLCKIHSWSMHKYLRVNASRLSSVHHPASDWAARSQWDSANSAFYFDIFIAPNEPPHPHPSPALSPECEAGLERE